jgi:hypothetical protein
VKKVQQAGDYSIFQKRSGRYAVQDRDKSWVNAEEKAKILLDAGLIKITPPKPPAPKQTEESAAEAGGEESAS